MEKNRVNAAIHEVLDRQSLDCDAMNRASFQSTLCKIVWWDARITANHPAFDLEHDPLKVDRGFGTNKVYHMLFYL